MLCLAYPVCSREPLAIIIMRCSATKPRPAALKLAIADKPLFTLDERELRRDTPSWTAQTLQEWRQEQGPRKPLAFITDSLPTFPTPAHLIAGYLSDAARGSLHAIYIGVIHGTTIWPEPATKLAPSGSCLAEAGGATKKRYRNAIFSSPVRACS